MSQSATLTPNAPSTTVALRPLDARDRCDAGVKGEPCGAQAWVRVTFSSGHDLLFCGHHYHDNAAALLIAGASVEDHTEHIPGANH